MKAILDSWNEVPKHKFEYRGSTVVSPAGYRYCPICGKWSKGHRSKRLGYFDLHCRNCGASFSESWFGMSEKERREFWSKGKTYKK